MSKSWLVVLTWNGKDDTLELLSSLSDSALPNTTVLVVDNASSDGTLEAVRSQHPWVQTIRTESNLGYAGGNNVGIRCAIDHGARVIGVLNNDTRVDKGFWEPLVELASRGGTAVSPDIRYANNPTRSWFYGATVSAKDGTVIHLQDDDQPPREEVAITDSLTGCCLVASADTWKAVGGFDEGMYLIFEDADWSMRARQLDVQLLLQPRSRVEHKVSQSLRDLGGLGLFYFCRNGIVFARRWLGPCAAARFSARVVVLDGLRDIRHHGLGGTRSLTVRCVAALMATIGRNGAAGPWIRRIATSRRDRA